MRCNDDGSILRLWLMENDLRGTLPVHALGLLTSLRSLLLSGNEALELPSGDDATDDAWSGMNALEELVLSGCDLQGSFPSWLLLPLTSLQVLDLGKLVQD